MSDNRVDAEQLERSKEDRLQQRKAAKKAAALLKANKRHKRQVKSKRNQLEREQKFVDVTYERAAKEWEQMMVDVHHGEMRMELGVLRDGIQKVLDDREHVIRRLTGKREEAHEQHNQHSHWHKQMCDVLKSNFSALLKSMRTIYDSEVHFLLEQFHKAILPTRTMIIRNQNVFENLLVSTNLTTDDTLTNIDDTLFKFTEQNLGNHQYNINRQCQQFVQNCERMRMQMQKTIESVNKRLTAKMYTNIVNRYEKDLLILQVSEKNIAAMQKTVEKLQSERQQLQKSNLCELATLANEKSYFTKCYNSLDERVRRELDRDGEKLQQVCSCANDSIKVCFGTLLFCRTHPNWTEYAKVLERLNDRGTKMLMCAQDCRCFEMQTEKADELPSDEELSAVRILFEKHAVSMLKVFVH